MATLVSLIIDKSSSMSLKEDYVINGINAILDYLRIYSDRFNISLTLFDDTISQKYINAPMSGVSNLIDSDYLPSGGRAVLDAVGKILSDTEAMISANQKTIIVVFLSGTDTSSSIYTLNQVKNTIVRLTGLGNWTFIFLGADKTLKIIADNLGFLSGNMVNFIGNDNGINSALKTLGYEIVEFANSISTGTAALFSSEEQQKINNII